MCCRQLLLLLSLGRLTTCFPNSLPSSTAEDVSQLVCSTPDINPLGLDVERLRQTISSGRVYQHPNFLSESQVSFLLEEMQQLENNGSFERSGLSNTVKGKQQRFGSNDRRVCAVPWWSSALKSPERNFSNNTAALRLNELRLVLAHILDRPTMLDASLAHECYYSTSAQGSFLPRHMDERHEELKGPKGWLLPSRRSLSWLVYLSDQPWTLHENGGALRAFSAKPPRRPHAPQHDGNLQVGWLLESSSSSSSSSSHAVYLDSWHVPAGAAEPHCILYTTTTTTTTLQQQQNDDSVQYLTKPWLNVASSQSMALADFIKAWAEKDAQSSSPRLFLKQQDAQNFVLLEDRDAWDRGEIPAGTVMEDITPERGLLVVFDSVMVPHQVQEIKKGRRSALAGWFHEETQPFPANLY